MASTFIANWRVCTIDCTWITCTCMCKMKAGLSVHLDVVTWHWSDCFLMCHCFCRMTLTQMTKRNCQKTSCKRHTHIWLQHSSDHAADAEQPPQHSIILGKTDMLRNYYQTYCISCSLSVHGNFLCDVKIILFPVTLVCAVRMLTVLYLLLS